MGVQAKSISRKDKHELKKSLPFTKLVDKEGDYAAPR